MFVSYLQYLILRNKNWQPYYLQDESHSENLQASETMYLPLIYNSVRSNHPLGKLLESPVTHTLSSRSSDVRLMENASMFLQEEEIVTDFQDGGLILYSLTFTLGSKTWSESSLIMTWSVTSSTDPRLCATSCDKRIRIREKFKTYLWSVLSVPMLHTTSWLTMLIPKNSWHRSNNYFVIALKLSTDFVPTIESS